MLDKPNNMQSVLDLVFDKYAGEDDEIEAALLAAARKDVTLMQEFLVLGVRQAMRARYSQRRQTATREPRSDEEIKSRLADREEAKRQFWDHYSLYGHRTLCDATAEELRESADRREATASKSLKRANFERALADKMGDSTKTVSQFFKHSQVAKMAERYDAG